MVRPHVSERDHFTLMREVPKSKGKYSFYTCKHCSLAYNMNPDLNPPELILGRSYNYVGHLRKCEAYRSTVGVTQAHSSDDDSSGSGPGGRQRPINTRLVFTKSPPRRKSAKRTPPKTKSQRRFSKSQKQELERLLVEFQAGNLLPDLFIERWCTKALLEYLCPGIGSYLPSRRVLVGRILKSHAAHCRGIQIQNLKQKQITTGGYVNFLSDLWQNISREHLLGCQLQLFGHNLTYSLPQAGSRHDGAAIAEEMDTILNQVVNEEWNVGAGVFDNAGQCGRTRRILALRWPNMVFLFCFAHCINNIVKAVLKSAFADVVKDATAAVKCLNASSSKWLVRARALMTECYAKPLALFTLCETQWNSMQSCLRLFFKFEAHSKYRGYRDFPSSLAVFSDLAFWRKLAEAEALIAPLPEASYRLQRDENTMADVVVSFRDIFVGFNGVLASYRCELVNGVESRWGQCEQPLFVLAFLLNPATADDCRKLIEETDHKKRVLEVEERLVQGRLPVDEQADISEEQQRIQDVKDAAKLVHRHNSQNFPFTAIADSLEMISIVFEAIGSNGLKTR